MIVGGVRLQADHQVLRIIRRGNVSRQLRFAGQRRGRNRGSTVMCGLLEGVAKGEQSSFRKLATQELDTHGQPLGSESGGHRERRKPNERSEAAVVAQIADASGIRGRERIRGELSGWAVECGVDY